MSQYEMNYRTLSAVTEDPNGEELGSFCIKQHPLLAGANLFKQQLLNKEEGSQKEGKSDEEVSFVLEEDLDFQYDLNNKKELKISF